MRILFLTQWFQPEPCFKGLPFARELARRGHDVEVLTGFPNYPGGMLYPGYKVRFFQRETMDGIRINRVPLYPSHNHSGLLRIFNYLSFAISAAILGPFVIRRPDVVYVYNLPTLGFVASIFKFIFRSKVVLDIQDLWPESVSQSKMMDNRIALSLLEKATNAVYSSADHITVLSSGFRNELGVRGIDPGKISVIYNWCNELKPVEFENVPECLKTFFSGEYFNVVFAGTMGKMQALDAVIKAAALVGHQNANIHFWFIGGGIDVERLKNIASVDAIGNVHFVQRVAQHEIGCILQKADLLLVHLKNTPLFDITIPSKIQAYLHIGRPILSAVSGEAAELVKRAEAGIDAEPENELSIAEAVLSVYLKTESERRRMGINGSLFYQKNLSLERGTTQYDALFNSLLA